MTAALTLNIRMPLEMANGPSSASLEELGKKCRELFEDLLDASLKLAQRQQKPQSPQSSLYTIPRLLDDQFVRFEAWLCEDQALDSRIILESLNAILQALITSKKTIQGMVNSPGSIEMACSKITQFMGEVDIQISTLFDPLGPILVLEASSPTERNSNAPNSPSKGSPPHAPQTTSHRIIRHSTGNSKALHLSWSARNIPSEPAVTAVSPVEMEPPASDTPVAVETATASAVPSTSPTSSSSPGVNGPPDSQSQSHAERQASITSSTRPDQNRERATVPSACVQCRSKHLKCDGLNPCTRCSSNSFDCVYVRSRRGFKGPRRNGNGAQGKNPSSVVVGTSTIDGSCLLVQMNRAPIIRTTPSVNVPSGLATPPGHRLMTLPRPVDLPPFDIGQELVSFEPKSLPSGLDLRERCLEAFFYHFYPAHPFMLPRHSFYVLRKEKPVEHLEACMRYVGSFYVQQAPTMALGLEAERAVYHPKCRKDALKVQAMLILAIGLDGYTYQEKALQILLDAQQVALELGMNKRDFAFMNSGGSDDVAESWRRTWWELYVVDGMIAGAHQKSTFRMKDIAADVGLPCEEKEYASGQIPPPHSMEDFDDESFNGRDFTYSSFAYRIAAIRNLGRVLASRQIMLPDVPTINRIDAYLVNWRLHLPDSKKDFVNHEGYLDEMLFQAHMITKATTILLHREHSELDSSVAHKAIVPGQSYNIHAAKTIQAAQDISKLIQLPVPLIKHTHLFTCVVTLASIVHLSCWSVLMPLIHDDDLKQQLRLNTGALKTLWQVWPSAGKAFAQVKRVAQEIYREKKRQAEVGFWGDLSDEDVMRSMIEDQTIMEELQLLN